MKCPKCIGKLEEKNVENVKVDICWVCEGVWFDQSELEKVLSADSRDFNKIDLDRDILDGKEAARMHEEFDEKIGICPKCENNTHLERKDYLKGVFVDICPKCQGIWLDGGEIHKLRDRTLVKIADRIYEIKSSFINSLKLLFKGRKKSTPNQKYKNKDA